MTPKPDFLIIGAMKAGTTTLYRDLEHHPQLFLPPEKEPDTLVRFGDDMAAIEADYASLFGGALGGQLRGEASTSYTKRPDHEGVAERAFRLCGEGLKLIFLARDPVNRAVSHYRHDFGLGYVEEPLSEALRAYPHYAAYSAYEWQLASWRERFGPDRLLLLDFEDYVENRSATLERVCSFLEIDPARLADPKEDRAFNSSEGKPVAKGLVLTFVTSRFYQRRLKPLVPWGLRDWFMHRFLPKAGTVREKIDPQTETDLRQRIAQFEELADGG